MTLRQTSEAARSPKFRQHTAPGGLTAPSCAHSRCSCSPRRCTRTPSACAETTVVLVGATTTGSKSRTATTRWRPKPTRAPMLAANYTTTAAVTSTCPPESETATTTVRAPPQQLSPPRPAPRSPSRSRLLNCRRRALHPAHTLPLPPPPSPPLPQRVHWRLELHQWDGHARLL